VCNLLVFLITNRYLFDMSGLYSGGGKIFSPPASRQALRPHWLFYWSVYEAIVFEVCTGHQRPGRAGRLRRQ
jgi:hypothetical protein